MLRQEHLSVLEARSTDDLLGRIVRFSRDVGFDRVGAMTVVDRPGSAPAFISIDDVPAGYAPLCDDLGRGAIDPVAQHCKRSSVPIVWTQGTYVARGLGVQWEQQQPFGYGSGISVALHMPHGRHFMFGVCRGEAALPAADELTRLIADVQLFAVHACEAAARLVLPQLAGNAEGEHLTPRELECLRWTMDGKTAWEVGEILGISERTAVAHVNSATHKLQCVSKHQAVIKAMRIGLLH